MNSFFHAKWIFDIDTNKLIKYHQKRFQARDLNYSINELKTKNRMNSFNERLIWFSWRSYRVSWRLHNLIICTTIDCSIEYNVFNFFLTWRVFHVIFNFVLRFILLLQSLQSFKHENQNNVYCTSQAMTSKKISL